jgi:hypothetical protein
MTDSSRSVSNSVGYRLDGTDSHASKVPEGKHEAVLLVVHVDRLGDALLSLCTRVDVQSRREDHEGHVWGYIADRLVLLERGGDGDVEEQDPWDSDLLEHLAEGTKSLVR